MTKKRKGKNNLFVGGLIVLFVILIVFGGVGRLYEEKVDYYNSQIFKTAETGGFTLLSAYENFDLLKEYDTSGIVVFAAPGDVFEGKMALKNHDIIDHSYRVESRSFESIGDGNISGRLISIGTSDFFVGPEGVKFFDYKIEVPEDMPNGEYLGQIRALSTDENAQKIVQEGVVLDVAIGVNIHLVVDDDPREVEYRDLSKQAKDLARLYIYDQFRYVLAGILGFLALFFLYKGLRDKK